MYFLDISAKNFYEIFFFSNFGNKTRYFFFYFFYRFLTYLRNTPFAQKLFSEILLFLEKIVFLEPEIIPVKV